MALSDEACEVAALGRPFALGMLYDCRKDALIPGVTLWSLELLKKDVFTRPQPSSTSKVIASDSIMEKASSLDISASLSGSFLGGLVKVGGSAHFLNDTKASARQARVSLSYWATTHFQQLSMSQVGKHNITYPEVFQEGSATHVVTGILYGARGIFVFDQEASSSESVQDIQGKLNVMVKKIPKFAIEGEGEAKLSDTDKATVEKSGCTFYGDFMLKSNPTTYVEAIQAYATLPTLLGDHGENAVPVTVWLYPLSKMDPKAARLVREISAVLLSDSGKVLEQLMEADMRSSDLLRDPTAAAFPEIRTKIQRFKDLCQEYRQVFQKQLADVLPAIRGGGDEESALAEILKKNEQSAFGNQWLSEFLDLKFQEIDFVKFFLTLSRGTSKICSWDDLVRKVLDPASDYVIALTFTSLHEQPLYLSELRSALHEASNSETARQSESGSADRWFQDKAILERARNTAMLFADFPSRGQLKEKVQFFVTSRADEKSPGTVIFQYESGNLTGTKVGVLSKPLPPLIDDISYNKVTLVLQPTEPEKGEVSGYWVQHRALGQAEWQPPLYVEGNGEKFTVTGLQIKTKYEFRYSVQKKSDMSLFSDVSKAVETTEEQPVLLRLLLQPYRQAARNLGVFLGAGRERLPFDTM